MFHLYLIRLINKGTLDFMSVEVESQSYLFIPIRLLDPSDSLENDWSGLLDSDGFQYNSLHDIESTWWVGVWIITCNEIEMDNPSESAVRRAEQQKRLARRYFPQTMRSTDRSSLLFANTTLGWLIKRLPKPFAACGTMLDRARSHLVQTYQEVEALPKIDSQRFDGMHSTINGYLQRAIVESKEIQICSLDELLSSLKNDTPNKLPPSDVALSPGKPPSAPSTRQPKARSGTRTKRKPLGITLPTGTSSSSPSTRRSSRLNARCVAGTKRGLSEIDSNF
jgi:hypothetical protein